jgi:hypothetical protein
MSLHYFAGDWKGNDAGNDARDADFELEPLVDFVLLKPGQLGVDAP